MENQIQDMTVGKAVPLIVRFSLPLMAGCVMQQLYNFVDTIVVGRGISMDALAAVGGTGSINFLVLGFIFGMAQGVSILCAQFFGSKDFKSLRRSITMSFYLNAITGITLTILSVAGARTLLEWMNTPAELLHDAVLYIRIIFGGILISLGYNFASGILRSLGDSKNPLNAMLIAFVINTLLDVLFVMGLHWGVAGAALATILAQAVSLVYCWICLKKIDIIHMHKEDWKWNGGLFWRSLKLSLPVALMNSITAVGVVFMQIAINAFGAVYIAAYSVASKILIMLEQIPGTFGMGTGTFVGQNLGALKISRIEHGVRRMNLVVIAIDAAIFVSMLVFGEPLIRLLVGNEPEVCAIAREALDFLTFFLFALGILFVYRYSLQNMSDTFWPMISGILEFAARTLAILILPAWIGFHGVLWAEVLAWISAAVLLVGVYAIRIRRLKKKYPQTC